MQIMRAMYEQLELQHKQGTGGEIGLYGALVVQRGDRIFQTAAAAGDVINRAKVDVFDPQTKRGYQRSAVGSRMRDASRYYEEGGRMPNPLLCNIREQDIEQVRVLVHSSDENNYRVAVANKGYWIGPATLVLPPDIKLWLYDGQHRNGGLAEMLKRRPDLSQFPVPLSVTLGLAVSQEMTEFFEVNTNAKSVKTDLAWELLRRMAEANPALALQLDMTGKDWITKGLEIVTLLESMEGPWKDRIQAPNERKLKSDSLTMGQAQFVQSLRPILDMPLFQRAEARTISQVLNAYWEGISIVLPEPFATTTSPKDWVIQKGPGVYVMHRVLPRVVEVVRARGQRLGDPRAYAEVLDRLRDLSGESSDPTTGQRVQVEAAEFWRSGPSGVAGAFSGDAGRKHLYLMVQAILPRPSDEIHV